MSVRCPISFPFYFILRLFSAYLLFLYGRATRGFLKTNTRSNGMRMIVSTKRDFLMLIITTSIPPFSYMYVYIFCICPPVENNLENRLLIHWFLPIYVCFLCLSEDSYIFSRTEKCKIRSILTDWWGFFLIWTFFDDLILVSFQLMNLWMDFLSAEGFVHFCGVCLGFLVS